MVGEIRNRGEGKQDNNAELKNGLCPGRHWKSRKSSLKPSRSNSREKSPQGKIGSVLAPPRGLRGWRARLCNGVSHLLTSPFVWQSLKWHCLFLVGDHFIIQRFSLLSDWSLAFSYMFCDFRSIYYKLHCSKAFSPRIQERAGSGVCEGPSREGTESYYMRCTAA